MKKIYTHKSFDVTESGKFIGRMNLDGKKYKLQRFYEVFVLTCGPGKHFREGDEWVDGEKEMLSKSGRFYRAA